MSFTLDKVVPWGRSFNEYKAMFSLTDKDLSKRILGCSDGPASFNCTLTKWGGRVVSADPIYRYSAKEIRNRINETYEEVIEQTRKNMDEFIWNNISSIKELGKIRMNAMKDFLSDFEKGKNTGRYIDAELPLLPFKDNQFDIALCSHFLFLYSEQFSADFHIRSIKELCRVATETRIFPLLELGSKKSRHLELVLKSLHDDDYEIKIMEVPYEFQKDGNEMLKVSAI